MNIWKACAIFEKLDSQDYSTDEKVIAIHMVADMETHNGINKDKMINAIKWLLEQNYEVTI